MGIPFFRTPLAALTLVWALAAVLPSSARLPNSSIKHKRNWNAFSNQTKLIREDPAELRKRDGSKYVFMHHVRSIFFVCIAWARFSEIAILGRLLAVRIFYCYFLCARAHVLGTCTYVQTRMLASSLQTFFAQCFVQLPVCVRGLVGRHEQNRGQRHVRKANRKLVLSENRL